MSVLSVLRYLNYEPSYALAEFVDNSLQSGLDHMQELRRIEGPGYMIRVEIQHDPVDQGRHCYLG